MMTQIEERLRALSDPEYRRFQSALVPTVSKERIIGVRVPEIRKLAKELDADACCDFLAVLPHQYYDENVLHAAILCNIRDFSEAVCETERFLPYVDNWAVCDMLNPRCFARNKEGILPKIREWIASEKTYTVRFGIGMMMRYFLDGDFQPAYLSEVSAVKSDDYYVNMMIAWYFATALAKQWDAAAVYIDEGRLNPWAHNKAIQKALESFRVSEEHKAYLKSKRI